MEGFEARGDWGFKSPRVHLQNPSNPVRGILGVQSSSSRSSDDIYGTNARYERVIKGIESWQTSQENKRKMLEFLRRIDIEGIGVVQRLKYCDSFRTFLTAVNKDFQDVTEKDIEQFLSTMQHYKPATRHLRWVCMKKFLRYQGKEDVFKNIKPKFRDLKHCLPEELLTPEEVGAMVNSVGSLLEKCLLKTLYESGMRSGEIMTLRLKHISFDEKGTVVLCNGKTGQRRLRLIESSELLKKWVNEHPTGQSEDMLWIKPDGRPAQHSYLNMLCKKAAKRAQIHKRIYNHLFRHSRASYLAQFLTESQMRVFFGWQGASNMVATYVHLSDRDVGDKILELSNMSTEKKQTSSNEVMEFFAFMMKQWKTQGGGY